MIADPFEVARAEALLVGYDARWAESMNRYEVLAVEVEFTAPLVNPLTASASRTWRLGGKLDAVVRERATRREGVVEHKTSGENIGPGSEYLRRLQIDGQVSLYFAGAKALGFDPEFCLYDILAKPRHHPLLATPVELRRYTKKEGRLDARQREADEAPAAFRERIMSDVAENPAAWFQRAEVVRLEAEIEEATHDIWQLGRQMRENQIAGRYPRNPDACSRYGRTCPFFDVCTGVASLDDPARFTRANEMHPELPILSAEFGFGSDVLTSSRLSTARACQRLHRYRYLDRYRPAVEADALRFGTLVHRGLEAWWRAPAGGRLDAALAALSAAEPANAAPALGA